MTKAGEYIYLTERVSRTLLKQWREKETFYCPQCKERVSLKIGTIVTPHFSHRSDQNCSGLFSEGESAEHLKGKQQLFEWFSNQKIAVDLEPIVRLINQRPDLCIQIREKQIPIEFQCSPLPIAAVMERTAGYQKIGMEPIWILQTPRSMIHQTASIHLFQLTKFQTTFLHTSFFNEPVFFSYCPSNSTFYYVNNLLHVSGKTYIGRMRKLPINHQQFPFAHPKLLQEQEVEQYALLYAASRRRFLSTITFRTYRGVQDPFLRACYEMRLLPSELPAFIGLPVEHNDAFKEHDCEWQLRLLVYLQQHKMSVHEASTATFQQFIQTFQGNWQKQVVACVAYQKILCQSERHFKEDPLLIQRILSKRFLALKGQN